MADVLGLTLSPGNVIEKVAAGSPFASKFKVGDTIISVNAKDASEVALAQLMESELESAGPMFELVARRPRAGSKQHGIESEGGAL